MARLVDQMLDPLVIIWLALIGLLAFHIWKRQKKTALIHGALVLFIFVIGSTPLAKNLLASLERPYFRETLADVPTCDAIVVLGGVLDSHGGAEEPLGYDATDRADRFIAGVELVKRGKARNLVFGGGSHGPKADCRSEGDVLAAWVQRWKLTNANVHSLGICANTHEEAMRVAELLQRMNWSRVILVTSAAHMARASATFKTAGVDVIPVACDFVAYPPSGGRWRFFPGSGQLGHMKNYLHEQVGWLYYRTRGWIKPGTG